MKKLFIMAVAAIAALSSCTSDIANGEENNGSKTLKAKMEVAGSRATIVYDYSSAKATPNWEVGDQIAVNGSTYQTKSAGTESELEAVSGSATGPYTAYFPASIYNSGTPTLPNEITETYTEGKFNMPMYAYSTTNELQFKNLCGVLAIKVDDNDIEQVQSIRVTSADKAICGAFTVDADNVAVVAAGDNTTLTVNYTSSVSPAATGTVFYIAIPKGQYGGLKIELSADGTTYTKSMTTKAGQNIDVERNFIYKIDFKDNSLGKTGTAKAIINGTEVNVRWVQLWAGGPRFAEYNVGADSETDLGTSMSFAEATKTGADYVWGANWCTPSQDDLQELVDAANSGGNTKLSCEYINNGFKFTGKEPGYTDNTVFFLETSSGGSNTGTADYWTSTAADGSNAKLMNLGYYGSLGATFYSAYVNNPYKVRPVLK